MTGNDQTIQASANLSSGGRLGFSCRPVSLSELSALVSRWGEEQDLPLGSLFHSTWQATQLALEFSILTSSSALPLPAGNGSAERRRERNGNASTAGRAARPPPATVSVPLVTLPHLQRVPLWSLGQESWAGGSGTLKREEMSKLGY